MLKLKAKDSEDLQVISAILQDSIVPVYDMTFRPDEKDFVMVVHRFMRKEGDEKECHERMRCAVHAIGVDAVQVLGIDRSNPSTMLDLLAVMPEQDHVQFVFAGGGKIRLKLGEWAVFLEDFGEPWPAACCPSHEAT